MYVNDTLALERDIEEAMARQMEDNQLVPSAEVELHMSSMSVSNKTRVSALEELSTSLGGGAGRVKEAVGAVVGVLAGFYGLVRKHPLSRLLRDDYTALALLSTAYSMLYTTAVALHDGHVAAIAHRHLRSVTPLIMELSRIIPSAVVSELAADIPNINLEAEHAGREATFRAWTQDETVA